MDPYLALAGAAVVHFGFTLRSMERRQSQIEYRLLALCRHLDLVHEAGSEPSEEVNRLASDGGKYIEALRLYRAETDADIKQAMKAIEPLRPRARDARLFK